MNDPVFFIWLLFLFMFAVLPIKSFFKHLYAILSDLDQSNTRTTEEDYPERHYSQLYRPGDKKYNKIAKLSNKAKSIN